MVQDTERVAEILAAIGDRNGAGACKMELDIVVTGQPAFADVERLCGGVYAVQLTDFRSDERCPSPGPATRSPSRLRSLSAKWR